MGCLRCISRVKSFHVKILLLDKQELIQEVTEKTTGQDLLDKVFKYLNLIETAYFGLRYQDNDNQTVSKIFFNISTVKTRKQPALEFNPHSNVIRNF